eukprot:3899361-Rhodomonas_salina.1
MTLSDPPGKPSSDLQCLMRERGVGWAGCGKQPAGDGDVCDGGQALADYAALHQLRQQPLPRQARLQPCRQSRRRHGCL